MSCVKLPFDMFCMFVCDTRRLYVKKCGELFDEKVESENTRMDSLQSAKDAMKVCTSSIYNQ